MKDIQGSVGWVAYSNTQWVLWWLFALEYTGSTFAVPLCPSFSKP